MANFEAIATQFVQYYYGEFDKDRSTLAALYRDDSMLTFESNSSLGAASIVEKLTSLPFQQVKHVVTTLDAQPSGENGVFILVTGQLLVDEEQRPMSYTQAFKLQPDKNGQPYIFNDIFKLIYAA